jgi:signal transduction histidine kinase
MLKLNVSRFPADPEHTGKIMEEIKNKGRWSGEVISIKKNKEKFPCLLSVSLLKDDQGNPTGMMGVFRDITERKKMEKELKEYSERLEEKVEERTKQLKETQEQLLKSERLAAIGQLAAMIGHDLRNPLAGISTCAYYLKKKLGSKMDEKAREMFELIEKDIQHSNKIINDLLDYAREIRLELTETTPKLVMKEAFSLVEIPEMIQVLDETQNEPKIKVDVEKMKRVFVNLVKNAVDAMPIGGKLVIESKKLANNVEIAITDTGTGMPNDVLEKLWTPLFTTKAKGMGLGLPICKRLVEAHRGSISVESAVGKGTTFRVSVPIEPKLEGGEKAWVKPPESLLLTTMKA